MSLHDTFLSAKEASVLLGVSKARIHVLCREGRFEGAEKIGLNWVIPKIAVLGYKRFLPYEKTKLKLKES